MLWKPVEESGDPFWERFHRVLLGCTGFYLVLPSFTEFYLVEPGLRTVSSGFTGLYRVLPGFMWFYRVLPSFTRSKQVCFGWPGAIVGADGTPTMGRVVARWIGGRPSRTEGPFYYGLAIWFPLRPKRVPFWESFFVARFHGPHGHGHDPKRRAAPIENRRRWSRSTSRNSLSIGPAFTLIFLAAVPLSLLEI